MKKSHIRRLRKRLSFLKKEYNISRDVYKDIMIEKENKVNFYTKGIDHYQPLYDYIFNITDPCSENRISELKLYTLLNEISGLLSYFKKERQNINNEINDLNMEIYDNNKFYTSYIYITKKRLSRAYYFGSKGYK